MSDVTPIADEFRRKSLEKRKQRAIAYREIIAMKKKVKKPMVRHFKTPVATISMKYLSPKQRKLRRKLRAAVKEYNGTTLRPTSVTEIQELKDRVSRRKAVLVPTPFGTVGLQSRPKEDKEILDKVDKKTAQLDARAGQALEAFTFAKQRSQATNAFGRSMVVLILLGLACGCSETKSEANSNDYFEGVPSLKGIEVVENTKAAQVSRPVVLYEYENKIAPKRFEVMVNVVRPDQPLLVNVFLGDQIIRARMKISGEKGTLADYPFSTDKGREHTGRYTIQPQGSKTIKLSLAVGDIENVYQGYDDVAHCQMQLGVYQANEGEEFKAANLPSMAPLVWRVCGENINNTTDPLDIAFPSTDESLSYKSLRGVQRCATLWNDFFN